MGIKKGSVVKLAVHVKRQVVPDGREDGLHAVVRNILEDGGVQLVSDLNGMKYWNVSDLKEVK